MTASHVRASSIRARELGRHLRRAQEKSGLDGKSLSRSLGWSESKVSRMLSGRASSMDVDVSAFLALCGVQAPERQRILQLCRSSGDSDTLRLGLEDGSDAYRAHAAGATHLTVFEPLSIPCATLDLPAVTVLLHERCLRERAADESAMSGRLHHLLRVSVRAAVSIHVVPATGHAVPDCQGGFSMLEFADYDALVYREEPTAGMFLGRPSEVAAYRSILADLKSIALDEESSRNLIRAAAADYADRTPGLRPDEADVVDATAMVAMS